MGDGAGGCGRHTGAVQQPDAPADRPHQRRRRTGARAISNAFGTEPLAIGAAHVARRDSDADIVSRHGPTADVQRPAVVHRSAGRAGARAIRSRFTSPPLSDLAVSLYLPAATARRPRTSRRCRPTTSRAPGDFTGAAHVRGRPHADPLAVPGGRRGLVDGSGGARSSRSAIRSPTARIRRPARTTAGPISWPRGCSSGPTAPSRRAQRGHHRQPDPAPDRDAVRQPVRSRRLARFDRDVLAQAGVQFAIVLLGINDIGHPASVPGVGRGERGRPDRRGYRQFIERAHEHGSRSSAPRCCRSRTRPSPVLLRRRRRRSARR